MSQNNSLPTPQKLWLPAGTVGDQLIKSSLQQLVVHFSSRKDVPELLQTLRHLEMETLATGLCEFLAANSTKTP